MSNSQDFPYTLLTNAFGETSLRPLLPAELLHQSQAVAVIGLVDSGSDVNVMPYDIGLALGLKWEEHNIPIQLSGNLTKLEARGATVLMRVGNLAPVVAGFAWTNTERAPLIFGQANFFDVFDVCFHRSKSYFSITRL